jgi:hypothetical protein
MVHISDNSLVKPLLKDCVVHWTRVQCDANTSILRFHQLSMSVGGHCMVLRSNVSEVITA